MRSQEHATLDVPFDADEAEIRSAYLRLVRRYPPERYPDEFAEIRRAYEALSDPMTYLENAIFLSDDRDSLEDVVADMRQRIRGARIPLDTLLSLGNR